MTMQNTTDAQMTRFHAAVHPHDSTLFLLFVQTRTERQSYVLLKPQIARFASQMLKALSEAAKRFPNAQTTLRASAESSGSVKDVTQQELESLRRDRQLEELTSYPVLGSWLYMNPDDPATFAVAFDTPVGQRGFVLSAQEVAEIARAMQREAAKMQSRAGGRA